MKLRIFILFMICMTMVSMAATPARARPEFTSLEEEVDAYITETMQRFPIPGLAVGIVKGDKVLHLKGYGTANSHGDPVTPQTPFMLASVTKTFTALGVQQLVRAGKLDLDAPVQEYLPEFRLADQDAGAGITVRHLLDHTSGITTIEGTQPYLHSPEATFDQALKELAHYKPAYPPGEQYEYSNWNYALLGEVISRASGQPYIEYMQEHVLDPLEMSRASFADYHTLPGVATGNLIVFGFPVPYDEKLAPATISSGYLSASAEDMTHYLATFYNHGQYNGHDLLPSQGLGWYDTSWYWHTGMPDDICYGFSGGHNSINTNIQLFPFHRVGVVVLMNTRLDELIPGPMVNDIAFNLARLTIQYPYELPSARTFYVGYALLDVFLLCMVFSILWQAFHLKTWKERYRSAAGSKRIVMWCGIVFNFLIFIGVLLFPLALGTRWNIAMHFRPDFAIPVLTVGICLGTLGTIKMIRSKL